MKKRNVKYIGSAVAVALLATGSPVIINQLVPTTIAEADGQYLTGPNGMTATQMLQAFRNQFDDRYVSSTDSLTMSLKEIVKEDSPHPNFFYFIRDNAQYIYDIQNNTGISKLKDQDKKLSGGYFGTNGVYPHTDYYYRDIKGYLSITGAGKKLPETLNNFNDLTTLADKIAEGEVELPITVTIHLVQGDDGKGTVYNPGSVDSAPSDLKEFSFTISKSRFDITEDTKDTSVYTGMSISDNSLQSGDNSLSVTDNYSNENSDSERMARTPIYGKSLFTSSDAAKKYAQSDTFDPNNTKSGDTVDVVDSTGKIVKAGTYYQTVSYKLDDGNDTAIKKMLSGEGDKLSSGAKIKPYETYINGSKTKATDGTDYVLNRQIKAGTTDQRIGMITVVRSVDVNNTTDAIVNTDKVSSTVGSSVSSLPAVNKNYNLNVADDAKTSIKAVPSAGTIVYKNYDAKTKELSDPVTRFASAGTYYRIISFQVDNADQYSFADTNVISSKGNVITYAQPISVEHRRGNSGSSNGTSDEDEWTYYKDPGVVTTKTAQSAYTLNNRANKTVNNRALAKNTSWITDQYRTNRSGVKQYRVATGEWIDSHDVSFRGRADNTTDEWTYYQDPGVVRTIIGQNYYLLNNQVNETISNRALAKESSWVTDQYRTNRSGVKEYRVATGEWIDSRDVTFIKDIKNIVNVDETSSYYNLYDIDREVNGSRALEKKTSWQADKKAVDPDGNVYYRVATNEWVKQVKGVYLDTYAWY